MADPSLEQRISGVRKGQYNVEIKADPSLEQRIPGVRKGQYDVEIRADPSLEQRISGVRKGQYDVEIINAVRDRPEIYDKSHENHKNPGIKELEWRRIAMKLRVPVGAVMKRWTVLRERFTAEKRKVIPLGPSSWWLMEHMSWLDAHIQPRQSSKSKLYSYDSSESHNNSMPILPSHYAESPDEDTRSDSPLNPIAYPEVLMEPQSPQESSTNSMDGEYPNPRMRLETHNSGDSNHWANAVFDADEAAAARILAALRTIDDPALRHQCRNKVHQVAQELELIGLKPWVVEPRKRGFHLSET